MEKRIRFRAGVVERAQAFRQMKPKPLRRRTHFLENSGSKALLPGTFGPVPGQMPQVPAVVPHGMQQTAHPAAFRVQVTKRPAGIPHNRTSHGRVLKEAPPVLLKFALEGPKPRQRIPIGRPYGRAATETALLEIGSTKRPWGLGKTFSLGDLFRKRGIRIHYFIAAHRLHSSRSPHRAMSNLLRVRRFPERR